MAHPSTTYESAEWAYNHREYLHAAKEGQEPFQDLRPSCMITGVADLPGQIAEMRRQGYVIHGITVHTYCGTCQGSGRIRKRNTRNAFAFRTCPQCKGQEGPLSSCKYDV